MATPVESSLLVGEFGDVLWVRVEGRGSFQNSPDLKAAVSKSAKPNLVVDLEQCPLMDSTFMGTLTALALRGGLGGLTVVNANDRNISLLENLGLDQIFTVDKSGALLAGLRAEVGSALLARATSKQLGKAEHAHLVLEAHEALAGTNAANSDRFRDVVAYLKSESGKPA